MKSSLSFVAASLFSATALGQGLSTPIVGTGRSSAATADPSAVYYNPAMMPFIGPSRLLIGGLVVVGDITYERDYRAVYQNEASLDFALPVAATAIDETKRGAQARVRSNPIAAAPGGFVNVRLGDSDFSAGLGLYSPYAAVIDFPSDGPQRFQLQEAFIATANVTPSVAWRPHRSISVGAGLSYVLGFAELSRTQDFASLADLGAALERLDQTNDFGPDAPPGVRELDVMARPIVLRQMWAHAVTFNVGVAVELTSGLRLGATYQHGAPMRFRGDFELDMDDDFFTQDLVDQGLAYPRRVEGDATLRIPLPAVLRLGARWQFTPSFAIGLDVAYSLWSAVDAFEVVVRSPDLAQPELGLTDASEIRLERDWRNTVGVDLFGDIRIAESVLLYARAGFRQSAVPDSTIDVASPDGDRIVGIVGADLSLGGATRLLGEIGVQTTLSRTVRGSDLDLGNGEYRLTLVHGGLSLLIGL